VIAGRRLATGLGLFAQFVIVRCQGEVAIMKEQLTAVFQKVPEGYIAFVEELPGANAQGDTLEEARSNLQEAVQLVLEANRALSKENLLDKSVIREPLAQIS
jgi:predicted RNase H-like HicB family nuclease